jgi:hypothetical protein
LLIQSITTDAYSSLEAAALLMAFQTSIDIFLH